MRHNVILLLESLPSLLGVKAKVFRKDYKALPELTTPPHFLWTPPLPWVRSDQVTVAPLLVLEQARYMSPLPPQPLYCFVSAWKALAPCTY